jgi:hypothetical protein
MGRATFGPAVIDLPQAGDGLDPGEGVLHDLAEDLADLVTGVPGGSAINGAAPSLVVLSEMR